MWKTATTLSGDRKPDGRTDVVVIVDDQEREEIAELAYRLWVQRGCPEGSPDEDWFRAEELLHRH